MSSSSLHSSSSSSSSPILPFLLDQHHYRIKVIPRARRTEYIGTMDDDTLKIRLKAVPEDGKVNTELLDFLEREADEKWEIVAGWTSRRKEVKYRRKTTLRDLIKYLQ